MPDPNVRTVIVTHYIRTAVGNYYARPRALEDGGGWLATAYASQVDGAFLPLAEVDFSNCPHVIETMAPPKTLLVRLPGQGRQS